MEITPPLKKSMSDTPQTSYEASIGDNANTVAVGNGISQFKSETHIHLGKHLEDYAEPVNDNQSDKSGIDKLDWITLTIGIIFFVINITSVFVPLIIYRTTNTTNTMPNWLLPLTSAMLGITGLMGVLVGYRISFRLKR